MVLDIEFVDKNVIKELKTFLKRMFRDILFSSFKKVQTHKAIVLVYKKLERNCVLQCIFVLVLVSIYDESLNTLSITNKENPKYQRLQNPTYEIEST